MPIMLINDIYYILSDSDSTATVAKKPYYETKYTGDIVIPNEVILHNIKYKVTSIESEAFSGCSGLTRITLTAL